MPSHRRYLAIEKSNNHECSTLNLHDGTASKYPFVSPELSRTWQGDGNALNYAVVGRGSVAVYGLLGRTGNLSPQTEL